MGRAVLADDHHVSKLVRFLVVVVVVAGLILLTPTPPEGLAGASCNPDEAWSSRSGVADNPGPKPDMGTPIDLRVGPPDTDGDGSPDTLRIESFPNRLVIERGAGTVTLTLATDPGPFDAGGSNSQPGDLDNDGRDELIVRTRDGLYLLPGTTDPGTHEVEEVAIRLADRVHRPAGDQDGDGGSDLVAENYAGETVVVRGRDLLALGPGGTAINEHEAELAEADPGGFVGQERRRKISLVPPIATYAGQQPRALEVTDTGPPRIVTTVVSNGLSSVVLHGDGGSMLSEADHPGCGPFLSSGFQLTQRDERLLVSTTSNNRSGSFVSIWYLEPKGGAEPIGADPTYTG